MRIELFGIARARAGVEVVSVEAADLAAALAGLAANCPGLVPEVLFDGGLEEGYLASLNGERFIRDADTPLKDSDTLLILGSQAGG